MAYSSRQIAEKLSSKMIEVSREKASNMMNRFRSGSEMDCEDAIELATRIVQDLRLQSPQTHLGMVTLFTTVTEESPLPSTQSGVRFTWFRCGQNDNDERVPITGTISNRPYYLPSVDDSNHKILCLVQDEYEQGLSRYLESDVLTMDPTLASITEQCLKEKHFSVSNVDISFGGGTDGTNICTIDGPNTCIELDGNGITITLPDEALSTSTTDSILMDQSSSRDTVGSSSTARATKLAESLMAETLKKSKASLTSLKSAARYIPGVKGSNNSSNTPVKEGKDNRENSKVSILRIAASDHLTVTCTNTSSLILGVPFKRGFPSSSSSSSSSNVKDSRRSSFMDRLRGATVGVAINTESPTMKNKQQQLISATTSHLPLSATNGILTSSTAVGVNGNVRDSPTSINTSHSSDAGGARGSPGSPGTRIGTPIPPWTYLHDTSASGTDDGSFNHCHAIVDAIENNVVAGLSDDATCVQISITCGSRTQRDALALMIRSHPINNPPLNTRYHITPPPLSIHPINTPTL